MNNLLIISSFTMTSICCFVAFVDWYLDMYTKRPTRLILLIFALMSIAPFLAMYLYMPLVTTQ